MIEQMTSEDLTARINELAAKNRSEGLTPAEVEERAALRAEYIRRFRASLSAELDNIYYVGDDGVEHKLSRRTKDVK